MGLYSAGYIWEGKEVRRQKRSRMKPALTGCGGDDGSGGREGATEMRWRERKGVRAEEKS